MRRKRYDKFRKHRLKRRRGIILIAVLVPSTFLIVGYLLTSLAIIPSPGR